MEGARSKGGLLETITHGETGILISANPSPKDLIDAVHELSPQRALTMRESCEKKANLFSTEIFLEKMGRLIET